MKTALRLVILFGLFFLLARCEKDAFVDDLQLADEPKMESRKKDAAGNNLSYPVIWAEGVSKTLPGTPNTISSLDGEWWYWWGTSLEGNPLSCPPDPQDNTLCDDGDPSTAEGATPGAGWVKAFLQKDEGNVWQAGSFNSVELPVNVDFIDWGDNLESVDWYTRSQVRTEVVLYKTPVTPMVEFPMVHTDGWGISEVHGMAQKQDGTVEQGPGTLATVYSPCARLTIQKLMVDRGDNRLSDLEWKPGEGWDEPEGYPYNLVKDGAPLFNLAAYESGDGPGYYSAEINVKGKIIYGYTWNVRKMNDGPGDYRITFSFDEDCDGVNLNTFLTNASIMLPVEETFTVTGSSTEGGGTAVLKPGLNLTYIDIRIKDRSGGGNGGNGGSGN
ncbi:MAG: hypothetical protein H6558_14185 [Lewinellaceae bacterium]|nr:hypothetical protein [Lewinellaceae bacterium]MCB9287824.1 hypothetical protein [Lewinellaceae bacterium]